MMIKNKTESNVMLLFGFFSGIDRLNKNDKKIV